MTEELIDCKACGTVLHVNDEEKLPNVQISIHELNHPTFNFTTVAECQCEKLKNPLEPTEVGRAIPEIPIKSTQWKHSSAEIRDDHDAEHDINGCMLWGNNWRQFTSVLPGILLFLTGAFQNVFMITELNQFTIELSGSEIVPETTNSTDAYDGITNLTLFTTADVYEPAATFSNQLILTSLWYAGAIIGCLCAAILVRKLKKRSIYVSWKCRRVFIDHTNSSICNFAVLCLASAKRLRSTPAGEMVQSPRMGIRIYHNTNFTASIGCSI